MKKEIKFTASGEVETKDDTVILRENNKSSNIGAAIAREMDSLEKKKVKVTLTIKIEEL